MVAGPQETVPEVGVDGVAAAAPDLAVGSQIAGRYQVLERLGQGAGGQVFRVADLTAGEEIAVKIIADPVGGIARLRDEMRLARKITHPNVCRVFDLVDHRHGALLAMEYLPGGTLAGRMGRVHTEDEVRAIAVQLVDGLEAAHQAGVLHRDLKPANILVGAGDRMVICDFGIARSLQDATATAERGGTGTPAYMAPEQLLGDPVDARADLYALGLILYELRCGHLPFVLPDQAPTLATSLRRTQERAPAPPAGTLAAGIQRLIEREPARRPASVAEARRLLGLSRSPARARGRMVAAAVAAPVAAAALWWWWPRASEPAPVTALPPATEKPQVLTSGEQTILQPAAFLPDGGAVVSINRAGVHQLWYLDSGGAASPLTSDAADKSHPHVAGEWLYFLREVHAAVRFELVRIPLAGLSGGATGPELVRAGVGHAVAASTGDLAIADKRLGWDGPGRLTLWSARTGATSMIADAGDDEIRWAWFAPDGSALAYLTRPRGEHPRGDLWVAPVDGRAPYRVAADVLGESGFGWRRDGQALVFFRAADGRRELVVVDRRGGSERIVERDVPGGTLPGFAYDGRVGWVADDSDRGIWLLEPDRPLRRLTFAGDEQASSPDWVAAEAGELVYLAGLPGGTFEIRRVGGPELSRVVARRAIERPDSSIASSPDGRHAAYGRRRGDESQLVVVELDGEAAPRVIRRVPWPAILVAPQFLARGRIGFVQMARAGGAPSVWDTGADGSGARLLVADAAGGFQSADGRWLTRGTYPPVDSGRTGLGVQALDRDGRPTGPVRELPGERPAGNNRFHPATGEVLVIDRVELAAIDPVTLTRRHLVHWPPGTRDVERCVGHPDGRIACAVDVGRSALMLARLPEVHP